MTGLAATLAGTIWITGIVVWLGWFLFEDTRPETREDRTISGEREPDLTRWWSFPRIPPGAL